MALAPARRTEVDALATRQTAWMSPLRRLTTLITRASRQYSSIRRSLRLYPSEADLSESLEDYAWLYRGVPEESPEVQDVATSGEIYPRRPGYVGEYARYCHRVNEMTDTGYTSWTTDPGIAEELARFASAEAGLSGKVVIFRVRISTIDKSRIYEGEAREDECLIEGAVEQVMICEDAEDEDEE